MIVSGGGTLQINGGKCSGSNGASASMQIGGSTGLAGSLTFTGSACELAGGNIQVANTGTLSFAAGSQTTVVCRNRSMIADVIPS